MKWSGKISVDDEERRRRMSRVSDTPPPLHEGVSQALRGVYAPDLSNMPQDMQDLLERLK